jgi:hypothetical protein
VEFGRQYAAISVSTGDVNGNLEGIQEVCCEFMQKITEGIAKSESFVTVGVSIE